VFIYPQILPARKCKNIRIQSAIDLYGANSPEVMLLQMHFMVGVGSAFVTADSIALLTH
jgi:hypothetical protein